MLKVIAGVLTLAALALFAAPPGYLITGQVTDEKGGPGCGVRVCAFIEGFDPKKPNVPIPCALSDQRGQFAIEVGRPGKYTLFYDQTAKGYWSPSTPFFRAPSPEAPEVVLNDETGTASVNVPMLPKNGQIAGRGLDAETGLPIDDLDFKLCHAKAPDICRETHVKNEEGEFKIPAPHVPFTIRVRAEGYDDWLGSDDVEQAAVVSIIPGMTARLNIRLKRSATAAGRALHESEKQVGSYEFDFVGAQPGRWRVWAIDEAGREGFKSPWRLFVYLR